MRNLIPILLLSLPLGLPALGDSWSFPAELEETEYKFGTTTIVRGVDGRENQTFPTFFVRIVSKGETVALLQDLSFQHIAASRDNELFVAISNAGIPYSALTVFDAQGEIRLRLDHHQGGLKYCSESVTLVRKWYDAEQPGIQFQYSSSGAVIGATVKSCSGKAIHVFELASDE